MEERFLTWRLGKNATQEDFNRYNNSIASKLDFAFLAFLHPYGPLDQPDIQMLGSKSKGLYIDTLEDAINEEYKEHNRITKDDLREFIKLLAEDLSVAENAKNLYRMYFRLIGKEGELNENFFHVS